MKPLVMLHGALGTKMLFEPLKEHLEKDFMIYTMDFSGHGQAALSNKSFSIGTFAEEVIAFLDENKLEAADILGYSMGGYVGLYLAHLYPTRIGKLFTLGTKIYWTEEVAAKEASRLDPGTITAKVPAFAEELKQRHEKTDWMDMLELTKDLMADLGKNNLVKEDILKEIQCPVCIAIGDKDHTVPAEEAVRAFRALPNGQLAILPNTMHPFEKVSLDEFSVMLKRFFA